MKKLLLMCCFLVGISAVSHAQGRRGLAPADQVAAWKTSLSLTDDQAAKAMVILTAQSKTMDSLRTAANGDFSTMRPAMTAMRTATSAKIKAILTPDQAAIYQKQLDAAAAAQAARQQGGN